MGGGGIGLMSVGGGGIGLMSVYGGGGIEICIRIIINFIIENNVCFNRNYNTVSFFLTSAISDRRTDVIAYHISSSIHD